MSPAGGAWPQKTPGPQCQLPGASAKPPPPPAWAHPSSVSVTLCHRPRRHVTGQQQWASPLCRSACRLTSAARRAVAVAWLRLRCQRLAVDHFERDLPTAGGGAGETTTARRSLLECSLPWPPVAALLPLPFSFPLPRPSPPLPSFPGANPPFLYRRLSLFFPVFPRSSPCRFVCTLTPPAVCTPP